MTSRDDPNCRIEMFLNCGQCVKEAAQHGVSPAIYARLQVGWTGTGIQVYCDRHKVNVGIVDFEQAVHPVDGRLRPNEEPHVSMYLGEDVPLKCDCCEGGRHVAKA